MTNEGSGVPVKLMMAVVGVISAVIGATVTHYYTRAQYLEKNILEFRQKAYTEFFQGQSLLWSSPQKETEANQLILSSKLKILLSGSPEVIKSMVKYWIEAGKIGECIEPNEKKKDVAIYKAMRSEFLQSLDLPKSDIPIEVLVPYLRSCRLESK